MKIKTLQDIAEATNSYEDERELNEVLLEKVINGELSKDVYLEYLEMTQGDLYDISIAMEAC